MAVHILFLLAYRGTGPSLPVPAQEPAAIAVTIRPPPPRAPPVVEPAPARPAAPAAPDTARRTPPKKVIAVPDSPEREAQPDPFVVQQPETDRAEPADEAPRFDMETAKRLARENAHMRDPSREGTALAQFPEKPLETETALARAIGKAKRRDCKDGIPGGLLAPLYLMMDKKNSGCKW